MDEDLSLYLLRALAGPMMAMGAVMLVATVLAPVILYVLARWRAHREPAPDTQVGVKFALHYFAMSAFQLALAGGALLLYTMISPGPSDGKGPGYRVAFGLLVPAGMVLALHLALLKRTNDELFPSVRRLFLGYNLVVTGLVGFLALVLGFQGLFAKGSTHGMGHLAGAMVLVYCTAWAVLGWRFGQLVLPLDGYSSTGGPPANLMTPPSATPPAAAAQGGLPALGGGSFPPIDQP